MCVRTIGGSETLVETAREFAMSFVEDYSNSLSVLLAISMV